MTTIPRYFTIIEEGAVTETLLQEIISDPRIEDVFEALKWRVSRDPDVGVVVQHDDIDYRLIFFRPSKRAKNSFILARYLVDKEEETITIDWIKVYPYDDNVGYSNPAFDIGN